MQFGDAWLSNGGDSAVIEAVGHGTAVAFETHQAVDDLLRPADHIVVRTKDGVMSIKLKRDKVGVLLARTQECRRSIGR
jgi:ribosomal protein S8